MEDPIRFDIYGKVDPRTRAEAVVFLKSVNVYSSEIEVRKAVSESCQKNMRIQLARSVTWSSANQFEQSCNWANQIVFCQEGYWPDDGVYCKRHNLYYGGVLGCHVCEGFYKK